MMKWEGSKEGGVKSPSVPLAKCFRRTRLKVEVKAESVTSPDAVPHHVPAAVPTHVRYMT